MQARPYDMSSTCKMTYITGEYMNMNYGRKFYVKGHNLNLALTAAYDDALGRYDVLVLPTITNRPQKLPLEGCSTTGKKNSEHTRTRTHTQTYIYIHTHTHTYTYIHTTYIHTYFKNPKQNNFKKITIVFKFCFNVQ